MKEKLHPFHLSILIFIIQQGVVIFSLPRLLAHHMGYNGWASLFIFSGIVFLNIFLISLVYRFGKGKSIFLIIEHAIPKFLAFPFYAVLIFLWILLGCIILKQYIVILQISVLPTLHPMYIKALLDIVMYTLLIKSIYNISKAATSIFWLVIWSLVFQLFFIGDFQWTNLTPFLFQEHSEVVLGGLSILNSFMGYELSLLLFPYYSNKQKGFIKSVYMGNLFTTITYVIVCFISFGFYNFDQLKHLKYPIIDMFAFVKLPVVERIENLIFGLFLLTTLIGATMYFWAALEASRRIVPKANSKLLATILILIGYIISWIPDTLTMVEQWLKFLGSSELVVAFGLPLLLLILLLFSKGARKDA